jgi:hypothetical protein
MIIAEMLLYSSSTNITTTILGIIGTEDAMNGAVIYSRESVFFIITHLSSVESVVYIIQYWYIQKYCCISDINPDLVVVVFLLHNEPYIR